jgi:hypothetical protein
LFFLNNILFHRDIHFTIGLQPYPALAHYLNLIIGLWRSQPECLSQRVEGIELLPAFHDRSQAQLFQLLNIKQVSISRGNPSSAGHPRLDYCVFSALGS